jgi:O-antigen/teichoic acid export membrane protein
LNNKTHFAFIITLAGAVVTILANVIFIPVYGYKASAIGHLAAYSVMMVISYFMGEKYYPIKYNVKKIAFYILLAVSIYLIDKQLNINHFLAKLALKTLMEVLFITFVAVNENILKIPYFKK